MSISDFKLSDSHVHFGKCSITGNLISDDDLKTYFFRNHLKSALVTPMDLALNEWNHKLLEEINHTVINIYGLYRINSRITDIENLFNTLRNNRNMLGVKFHPSFDGFSLSSTFWDELFKWLDRLRVLVLVHCGRSMKCAHYSYALNRAELHPRLTFILAHMGGNDLKISISALKYAERLENVYFDTSNVRTPYIIEEAVACLGPERILFGSDYPWGSCYSNAYTIIDAKISDDDIRIILSRNLEDLVKRILLNEFENEVYRPLDLVSVLEGVSQVEIY